MVSAGHAYGFGLSPSDIEVVRTDVARPSLPSAFQGFRIAYISDIHYGSSGIRRGLVEQAFWLAIQHRPDILCLGGDIITGWSAPDSLSEVLAIVRGVSAPLGVYAVLGNHEFRWGADKSTALFEQAGIRTLRNERVDLTKNGMSIPLVGLDNAFNQTMPKLRRQIDALNQLRDAIVLQHTPDIAPMMGSSFRGLIVSGHTHGGQIILPLVGQVATASRFGLVYSAGLFPAGGGTMYISRGVGAVVIPMRIHCPPEVSIIDIAADSLREAEG